MSICTMNISPSGNTSNGMPRIVVLLLAAAVAACTPEYTLKTSKEYAQQLQLMDQSDVHRSRHYVLNQRSRFYLGRIDATDDAAYIAIGKLVSDSFERHFDDVIVSPNPLSQEQARQNARANRCHYTLAVMVEYWDDENHQWVSDEPVEDTMPIKPVTGTRGVMSSRSFKNPNAKAAAKTNDDQMVRVKMTVRDSVTDQLVDAIEMKSKPGYLQGIDEEAMKMLEPALRDLTASLAGDNDD
jgi:hypothetical protein